MDLITLVGGILAATGAGFGVGIGSRALRTGSQARRDLKQLKRSREAQGRFPVVSRDESISKLARPDGRKRDCSIAGLHGNTLRHTNGDYSCAWEAKLEPTMLAHDHTIESRCDELARMLAVDKPPGTLIQFRLSSGPDLGHAILKHLEARGDCALTHPDAARLHESSLEFYEAAAAAHRYRQCVLSLWARVPGKQKGDDINTGLNAFIPRAFAENGKHGLTSVPAVLRRNWSETADNGVVRRLFRDEIEARERAEKVFRLVERECPLTLQRLDSKLWEAVYLGHRQDAQSVPSALSSSTLLSICATPLSSSSSIPISAR